MFSPELPRLFRSAGVAPWLTLLIHGDRAFLEISSPRHTHTMFHHAI